MGPSVLEKDGRRVRSLEGVRELHYGWGDGDEGGGGHGRGLQLLEAREHLGPQQIVLVVGNGEGEVGEDGLVIGLEDVQDAIWG